MNFAGMLGGFIAETTATGMTLPLYFHRAFSLVGMTDYVPATLKTMVFGFIIASVSSYLGFNTDSGTEGVGRASTRAVVLSSILIIVVNVVLVRLIFFIFPEAAGG
jgi:phospholipid/cholesterol/gamma-HCH transport system permease protein